MVAGIGTCGSKSHSGTSRHAGQLCSVSSVLSLRFSWPHAVSNHRAVFCLHPRSCALPRACNRIACARTLSPWRRRAKTSTCAQAFRSLTAVLAPLLSSHQTHADKAAAAMALVHLLSKSLVKDAPRPKGGVITIKSTENPRAAYKKLSDNNIHSAPIFDVREVHRAFQPCPLCSCTSARQARLRGAAVCRGQHPE